MASEKGALAPEVYFFPTTKQPHKTPRFHHDSHAKNHILTIVFARKSAKRTILTTPEFSPQKTIA